MTDIEQVFLADIIRNPDDDTPRLVYADWLEIEAGQGERAEFIRVQIELARMGRENFDHVLRQWDSVESDARSRELVRREHKLFTDANAIDWCQPLGLGYVEATAGGRTTALVYGNYPAVGKDFEVTFRRGFVTYVRCPLDAWHGRGPALCREHPIEGVEIAGVAPENVGGRGRRFMWYLQVSAGQVEPHYLPAWLMSCLPRQSQLAGHKTPQHAHDALNAAALLWARAEGLSTPRGEA